MDTGKVPFGTEVYLVIKNPLYKERCPYCGHKNSEKVDKWMIAKGIYNNIRIFDGTRVFHTKKEAEEYIKEFGEYI